MCSPKMPEAPDPKETAAAQTATNISTAKANTTLGQVNQVGPYGSQTFSTTGHDFIDDPNGAVVYYNPATGEFRNDAPTVGVNTPGTPGSTGPRFKDSVSGQYLDSQGRPWVEATKGSSSTQLQDGWQKRNGYQVDQRTLTTSLAPAQQAVLDQNNRASLNLSTLAADASGRLGTLLGQNVDTSGAPSQVVSGNYRGLRDFSTGQQLDTTFGDAGNVATTFGDAGDITRSYASPDDFDTSKFEDALNQRQAPALAQARQAAEQKAANMGLQPGSPQYDRFIDQVSRQENDSRLGSILSAGQEQSRQVGLARDAATFANSAQAQDFGQQQTRGTFANSAQQQIYDQLVGRAQFGNTATQQNNDNTYRTEAGNNAVIQSNNSIETQKLNEQNAARAAYLNELYAQRQQPINEITALLSGSQVRDPNFGSVPTAQLPTVDYAGLVQQDYQNKLGAYQAGQANNGAILGGLASLFKGVTLSDKTAKKDIKRVGKLKGHALYEYRYRGKHDDGERHIGVLAQEVEKRRPDAVVKGADGLRRVNYGELFAARA